MVLIFQLPAVRAECDTSNMPSEFSIKVISIIQKVPRGQVATYGQIAALAGKPHAARAVSWLLHSSSKTHRLPWHRIIGSKGRISLPKNSKHYFEQVRKLESENVELNEAGEIDLDEFQWSKKPPRERRNPGVRKTPVRT